MTYINLSTDPRFVVCLLYPTLSSIKGAIRGLNDLSMPLAWCHTSPNSCAFYITIRWKDGDVAEGGEGRHHTRIQKKRRAANSVGIANVHADKLLTAPAC